MKQTSNIPYAVLESFMLAGKAIFTVADPETGKRYTYKIRKPTQSSPHFVSVLTGPDNSNHFTFFGTIFEEKMFRPGKNAQIPPNAPSVKMFERVWDARIQPQELDKLVIMHEGKCGRCGRRLTTPESIEQGFGPECINKVR